MWRNEALDLPRAVQRCLDSEDWSPEAVGGVAGFVGARVDPRVEAEAFGRVVLHLREKALEIGASDPEGAATLATAAGGIDMATAERAAYGVEPRANIRRGLAEAHRALHPEAWRNSERSPTGLADAP